MSLKLWQKSLMTVVVLLAVFLTGFFLVLKNNTKSVEVRLIQEVDEIIKDAGLEPVEEYEVNGNPQCLDVCYSVKKSTNPSQDAATVLVNLENNNYNPEFSGGSTGETYNLESSVCKASIRFNSQTDKYSILCLKESSFLGI